MPCFRPFFKKINYSDVPLPLPCGRCEYCRSVNQRLWSLRLFIESKNWHNIAFVTLTYDHEHCPSDYSLVPSHLTNFTKRLRYYLDNYCVKIKVFSVGEYGSRYGRPHYHLLIFGLPRPLFHLVKSSWSFGMVDIDVPRDQYASIKYITNYVMKKIGSLKSQSKHYLGRFPPFLRASKGLGLSLVDKLNHFVDFVYIGKKKYVLGRYLRLKLSEKLGIVEQVKERSIDLMSVMANDLYIKGMSISPDVPYIFFGSYSKYRWWYENAISAFKSDFLNKLNIWSLKYENKN